jgi:alpha-amylase
MDYETFGEHQWEETGIFEFLKALPETVFAESDLTFSTPSEVAANLQVVSAVQVPYPISWADEERDLTAWLGNELQEEAYNRLYDLGEKLKKVEDPVLQKDWDYLQVSDHFYYMCTKFFSDGAVHSYFNPFDTPYDAFINYMNVLSDFTLRVNAAVPQTGVEQEISNLTGIIEEKDNIISRYEEEIYELNKQLLLSGQDQSTATKTAAAGPAKKTASRKPSTKKSPVKKAPAKRTATASSTEAKTPGKAPAKRSTAEGSGKTTKAKATGTKKSTPEKAGSRGTSAKAKTTKKTKPAAGKTSGGTTSRSRKT